MTDVQLPVISPNAASGGGDARESPGDGSATAARAAVDELESRIEGEVRLTRHDRMLYATDASIYQVEPIGVVIPRSIADVEETVRFCAQRGLPVLPRGGGTSLAGQVVNTAIVIDFSPSCNRILEVDAASRVARVEPGVVLDRLNEAAGAVGLAFGPDVATSTHATLGGMIGNNSAGAHSILYGRTVEHVRAVEHLLADGSRVHLAEGTAEAGALVADLTRRVVDVVRPLEGEIDRRFPRTRRRVDGYNLDLILAQVRASTPGTLDRVNLAHLICGAEGTLGVTLEATVGLVEAPALKGLAIVAFRSVDDALAALAGILDTRPAAVELVDDVIIGLAAANIEYRRYLDVLPATGDGGAVLYVEYFVDTPDELGAARRELDRRFGADTVTWHDEPAAMAAAWKLRKAGEPLLHGQLGARKPITFVEDTAVDPSRLPEFMRSFRAIVERHGTTASYYAHASVGCLHVRPMICLSDPDDVDVMQRIVAEVTDLVVEYGGALSGEHGDGRLRSHLLERFYGSALCEGFRAIRAIFDPDGRMNPRNITDPLPMTEHWRIRPESKLATVPDVRTHFRYEREHGFGEAVERCNGAGVCRRTSGGTMCPSYRATRDERHSTRGRGNALRLAITGQLAANGGAPLWGDPETLRTLDLCLSCKACKSECPSNVDIGRLKAEYLAQGYAESGVPPAARLFSRVRTVNRLTSLAPGLANLVAGTAPFRALTSRLAGIDRRRTLPPAARSLHRWFAARPDRTAGRPAVVLFGDCFATYNEPAVGRAAVEVLETLGYHVVLPRTGCCGRPHISNGLLAEAAGVCARTARQLSAAVERSGAGAIVTCEPSCLSAITDDWLDLEMGVDRSELRRLAALATAVEDFVERRWAEHPIAPNVGRRPPDDGVLLHGHCHQKALNGVETTVRLLGRLSGGAVTPLDSGCCGMAGAFGYTRDRFDLSMNIAELALFPALRAAPEAAVVAPGTSCRHQIRDGLGRVAVHPIEMVREAMRGG